MGVFWEEKTCGKGKGRKAQGIESMRHRCLDYGKGRKSSSYDLFSALYD